MRSWAVAETLTIELHNRPSAGRVRDALSYDAETGEFAWNISTGRVRPGVRAGVLKPSGYVLVQIDGRSHGAHRLAWLWMTGEWPKDQIDHINGNRRDNRFCNLRDVPGSVNQQNQRVAQSHNRTSRYLGVSWHSRSKKWRAAITLKGRTIEIGKYSDELEAHAAYLNKKREIHQGCVI